MKYLLALILLSFVFPTAQAADLRCAQCRGKITGRYVEFNDKFYHPACFDQIAPKCAYCKKPLTGQVVKANGREYHQECYLEHIAPHCPICGKVISDKYVESNDRKYHEECYLKYAAPHCAVCDEPLSGKYSVDYWGNKYHSAHEKQYPSCEYCGRMICKGITGGGRQYKDGRHICNICYRNAVTEKDEVNRIVQEITRNLYWNSIDVKMDNVTIELVDKPTLSRMSKNPGKPREMGLAQCNQKTRRGKIVFSEGKVYILHGLPLQTFRGVLAHELMHVWAAQNCLHSPEAAVSEGSANYASFLIYQRHNDEMSRFLLYNLQDNPDPVYGDGYRAVKKHIDRYGITLFLDELRKNTFTTAE